MKSRRSGLTAVPVASWGGASTCGTRGTIAIGTQPAAPRKAAGSLPPRMPTRRTKRGGERTPLAGDYDVIVCGASFARARGRTRAGGRRPRAAARPVRDRRAPDVRLCGADRLAGGARPRGLDPPDVRQARHAHPPLDRCAFRCRGPSRRSTTRSSASCSTTRTTPTSRPRRWRGAAPGAVRRSRSTRTAATVSAPLVVDALGWRRILGARRLPAAGRSALARPRGASARLERRARDLGRPRDRPGRLRMELPGRRRGASRRRVVRPPLPRQGPDRRSHPAAAARRRPLPGELDSAPASARGRRTTSSSRATLRVTACR